MISCGGQVVTCIPIFPNRNLVRHPGFFCLGQREGQDTVLVHEGWYMRSLRLIEGCHSQIHAKVKIGSNEREFPV